jgi:hypothetical protein
VRGLVLAGCDLVALNAAFLTAFGVRKLLATQFAKPLFAVTDYWQFLLVFNLAAFVALRRSGLYRRSRPAGSRAVALRAGQAVMIAAFAVLVSTFFLYIRAYSRFVIALTVPLAIAAITAGRAAIGALLARLHAEGLAARRVLVAGDRELAEWMAARPAVPGARFEVVGVLDLAARALEEAAAARARGAAAAASRRAERVQEVVIADRDGRFAPLAAALAGLARGPSRCGWSGRGPGLPAGRSSTSSRGGGARPGGARRREWPGSSGAARARWLGAVRVGAPSCRLLQPPAPTVALGASSGPWTPPGSRCGRVPGFPDARRGEVIEARLRIRVRQARTKA